MKIPDQLECQNGRIAVGRWASRSTNVSIANTLTQVVGATMPANGLAVGTLFRFSASGLLTNTTGASTSVITLRAGTTSLSTPIVGSWSVALGTTARTNCPFLVDADLVTIGIGGGGSMWGQIVVSVNSVTALVTPTTMITAAVAVDTTVDRVIELACISGASSTTWNFVTASIEIVK